MVQPKTQKGVNWSAYLARSPGLRKLTILPGSDVLPLGRCAQCGSSITRNLRETKHGRSVTWYELLKPTPKRPVFVFESSSVFRDPPMCWMLSKSRSVKTASL